MAPGALYPVLYEECVAGDKIDLSLTSLVKTYPLLSPLLGSYKLQFDVFYAPMKNYIGTMHSNTSAFDPLATALPTCTIKGRSAETPEMQEFNMARGGNLWDFFGIPTGFVNNYIRSGAPVDLKINALPLLSYLDICRNYYAAPQDATLYFCGRGGVDNISNVNLNSLANDFTAILSGSREVQRYPTIAAFLPQWFEGATVPGTLDSPMQGFCLRSYAADLNSAWLNGNTFSNYTNAARVNTDSGSFTVDQLNYSSKLWKYLMRTMVAGGRFDDYIRSHFGVTQRTDLMYPEFLGSTSTGIMFDDVVQTAPGTEESPLGSLAGRGIGMLSSRKHYYNVKTPGYLMVIASLVPNVDYCEGLDHNLMRTNWIECFDPAFDCIGFQPRMMANICALPDLKADGKLVGTTIDPTTLAVGEQPAWTEYMTSYNRLHGELTRSLKYWALARPIRYKSTSSTSTRRTTAYIRPSDFNYAFADTNPNAQNFIVQCKFNLFMKRPISKQVMPTL